VRSRSTYDVVVAGGGTAGAIAAIAAARTGARTLVIERYGYLGGVLSLGMGLLGSVDAEGYWALGGIGRELTARLQASGGATAAALNPAFGSILGQDPELLKLELLEMALDDGVDLLFHATVIDAMVDDGQVRALLVATKRGVELVPCRAVVDCTGDADVVAAAGGQFSYGRGDGPVVQPVSRIFRVGGVDLDAVFGYLERHPAELRLPKGWGGTSPSTDYLRSTPGVTFDAFPDLIEKAKAAGDFPIPRSYVGMYTLPGRDDVGINLTRAQGIDGTDPDSVTRAEVETQRQMLAAVRFLRRYVPGFADCVLISAPHQLGVRETRHIISEYLLSRSDVMSGADFDDQVGRGAYPLDLHDPAPDETVLGARVPGGGVTLLPLRRSYGIPRRCLVPRDLANMTVGGRCIAATHEAAGSVRGQAVCMVTGHAAGTMAALASADGGAVSDVPLSALRSTLVKQGAILGRTAEDRLGADG